MTNRSFLLASLTALLAIGCLGAHQRLPKGERTNGPAPVSNTGIGFSLSDASPQAAQPEVRQVVAGSPLSTSEAEQLLRQLPDLMEAANDPQEFTLPERSLPSPHPGMTIQAMFSPREGSPPAAPTQMRPLEIERFSPEGEVPLAPNVSLTFSEPMVPVASLGSLSSREVPARISPEPEGSWTWLGSRTLVFQPKKRLPMATEFTVTVPAGVEAMGGQPLGEEVQWSFTTPPPALETWLPKGESVPLEPVIFLAFDQAIEPDVMLASVQLFAGGERVATRPATREEIEAKEGVRLAVERAAGGRWLAIRPMEKLPGKTKIEVRIAEGARSAEGPLSTANDQHFEFTTLGPLELLSTDCGEKGACDPFSIFRLEFSNTLDRLSFDPAFVTVSPDLPGLSVRAFMDKITVTGRTKGQTEYTVTLAPELTDIHGQELGEHVNVSFKVGSSKPRLIRPDRSMIVLDPRGPQEYLVYTIDEVKLRAQLFSVEPHDWAAFEEWRRISPPERSDPPGHLISDEIIHPPEMPDELATTPINLAPALEGGFGHVIVRVTALDEAGTKERDHLPDELAVWVQATNLGITAYLDHDRTFAWITDLTDGKPLNDVEVFPLSNLGPKPSILTKDGLATISAIKNGSSVVARQGKDMAFTPSPWAERPSYLGQSIPGKWFVFTDRGVYQPGETVHVKGWVRTDSGGLSIPSDEHLGKGIEYRVFDGQRVIFQTGRVALDEQGGFDFTISPPESVNLGRAWIQLWPHGSPGLLYETRHSFFLEQFRKPEFETHTQLSEGPHFIGDEALATTNASYYSGGGLAGSPITWTIRQTSSSFKPPLHEKFHFGPARMRFFDYSTIPSTPEKTWTSQLDEGGSHHLKVKFKALEPAFPFRLTLASRVEDLNRQAFSTRTSALVHPSDRYVGIRLDRNFVQAGQPIVVDLVVTDLSGTRVPGRPIDVRAARLRGSPSTGNGVTEVDAQSCEAVSDSTTASAQCTFQTTEGGLYRITATVQDERGRKNQSIVEAWVLGQTGAGSPSPRPDSVSVVMDKSEYLPGERATILILSPFAPAEGVLSARRSGVVRLQRFTMKESSKTLEIELDESMVPNVELVVDLVRAIPSREADGKFDPSLPNPTISAKGSTNVKILPISRTLQVRVRPEEPKLSPGSSTTIELEVLKSDGRPAAAAQVALFVVDEAILSLSNYETPDPLSSFYMWRFFRMVTLENRTSVSFGQPPRYLGTDDSGMYGAREIDLGPRAKGSLAEGASQTGLWSFRSPFTVRSDFESLALFAPNVLTDANGRASVSVKLPDNLTRYRVMAVAAAGGNLFGSAESSITARLPLMVRPSAPRFLTYGDSFELSVLLQNQTDAPVEAAVVARATNASLEGAARGVTIPANDRVEVRFPVTTQKVGSARFQIGVSAPGFADAVEVEVPVNKPATTETFATYGELGSGAAAQSMELPEGVYEQFGGLEITTSSTQLPSLTDAVRYLAQYPFNCREQVASRVLAISSLRDVLTTFRTGELPPPEEVEAAIKEDLEDLARSQHPNGGWSFWPGQRETWPYVSVHVAHALIRAKEKGHTTSDEAIQRAMSYLRTIDEHTPSWYGKDARRSLEAYAHYVRWRGGDSGPEEAVALIEAAGGVEELPLEAVGWIWPTLTAGGADARSRSARDSSTSVTAGPNASSLAAIRRHIGNRVTETAGSAHFATSYGDQDWVLLHSGRRTDGVLLEAVIADQPDSTLIPKLVKGLLGHRKAGRWLNTQENAFVLLALERYFNEYEKVSPDFVARLWLGESYVGEHSFRGHQAEQSDLRIPMQWLVKNASAGPQDLILAKDGPGRLYYRIGMSYAPTDLELPPLDRGFTVSRSYEGADDPGDVERGDDGSWRIRLGARVRVRVSMVAPARRQHVALVDPLPAGLEPLNPALAVTGALPKDPKAEQEAEKSGWWRWLWSRTWYEHQNLRDDRAEAFASLLYSGVWEYSYLTTATTPGTFVAPPTKAEEMYSPETFGRGTLDRVIVLER